MYGQSCQCDGEDNFPGRVGVSGAVAEVPVVAGAGSPLLAVVAGRLVGDEAAALLHRSIWK